MLGKNYNAVRELSISHEASHKVNVQAGWCFALSICLVNKDALLWDSLHRQITLSEIITSALPFTHPRLHADMKSQ